MLTYDWPTRLDAEIVTALKSGRVSGVVSAVPDHHIETGLAHIFFFGDRVFKLYKTHNDHTHFIKGVFAPTRDRIDFLDRDHALNTHFSRGIYQGRHTLRWDETGVCIEPLLESDTPNIHLFVEMVRLDFEYNVHELLLAAQVTKDMSYQLGWQTAELVATYEQAVPSDISWYELAIARLGFLEKFIDWLPAKLSSMVIERGYIRRLTSHLERHRDMYQSMTSEYLTVTLDNHDENLFYYDDTLRVIDVLPPMSSWWYGPDYINLANVMTNVSVLASPKLASAVYDGYVAYTGTLPPTQSFQCALAMAHVISIAHFGSVPEKYELALQYLEATEVIFASLD